MKQIDWSGFQELPLSARRAALTCGFHSSEIAHVVTEIITRAASGCRADLPPLRELQRVLEEMRALPPSIERLRRMNTFVRTLGQPNHLAILLDVLRGSLHHENEFEAAMSNRSRGGRMHCIYGWAGQTLVLASHPEPTSGTEAPIEDMAEFLGYPPAEWDMSVHIWQPHPDARGFSSMKRVELDVIVEPPHSHPFSFVSYVAKGLMHQSIYATVADEECEFSSSTSRYAGVTLQEVDGVWPPHQMYRPQRLSTLEDRVLLQEGDSYFLSPHAIHDVEIARRTAARTPAITLFLCAEATVKPKAYLAPDMADYHRLHPELKEVAVALETSQWDEKLRAVASYLRGEAPELFLDEVVRCNSTYSFLHV